MAQVPHAVHLPSADYVVTKRHQSAVNVVAKARNNCANWCHYTVTQLRKWAKLAELHGRYVTKQISISLQTQTLWKKRQIFVFEKNIFFFSLGFLLKKEKKYEQAVFYGPDFCACLWTSHLKWRSVCRVTCRKMKWTLCFLLCVCCCVQGASFINRYLDLLLKFNGKKQIHWTRGRVTELFASFLCAETWLRHEPLAIRQHYHQQVSFLPVWIVIQSISGCPINRNQTTTTISIGVTSVNETSSTALENDSVVQTSMDNAATQIAGVINVHSSFSLFYMTVLFLVNPFSYKSATTPMTPSAGELLIPELRP